MRAVRRSLSLLMVSAVLATVSMGASPSLAEPSPATPEPVADAEAAQPAPAPASPVSSNDSSPPDVSEVELPERRTLRSRTFRLGDRFRTEVAANAIHFRDGQGRWQPIDDTLVASDEDLVNKANRFRVSLPPAADRPVKVEDNGRWVSFTLDGATPAGRSRAGGGVRYEGARPGLALSYDMLADGVKETVTLTGPQSPAAWSFTVRASAGLTAKADATGAVTLTDSAGQEAFQLAAPFALDSAPDAVPSTDAVRATLAPVAEGWRLTVVLDEAWRTAPGRVWPVMVDPTILTGFNTVSTCPLHQSTPTVSDCFNYDLFVSGGATRNRSLLRFDELATAVPQNAVIITSGMHLKVKYVDAQAGEYIGAHAVTSTWTSAASWNNRATSTPWTAAGGDYDSTVANAPGGLGTIGSWMRWDLSALTARWVDQSLVNQGVLLRQLDETKVQSGAYHGKSATSADLPRLEVEWSPPMGRRPTDTLWTRQLTDRLDLAVNVATGNLTVRQVDFADAGHGPAMTIDRTYNSLNRHYAGPSGNGWSFGHGNQSYVQNGENSATVTLPSFATVRFTRNANGIDWTSPPALNATLTEPGAGKFRLTFNATGERWDYDLVFPYVNGIRTSRLTSRTDRNGNKIDYEYASTITWPTGISSMTGFNDPGRGHYTVNNTGPDGRALFVKHDASGRQATYGYSNGNLTSVVDADSKTTTFAYDNAKRLIRITTPEGRMVRIGYNGTDDGRAASVTMVDDVPNDTGPFTDFAYTSTTGAGTSTVHNWWRGTVTSARKATTYAYDASGKVTRATDPLGRLRDTTYTANGDVQTAVDGMGKTTTNGYDSLNNPTSVTLPTGAASYAAYAGGSYGLNGSLSCASTDTGHKNRPHCTTNADGNSTAFTYDTPGNVSKVKDTSSGGAAAEQTFTYNPPAPAAMVCGGLPGQVCTATDGRGKVTSYTYNTLGQLTGVNNPAPLGDTSATYDTSRRPATVTDGKTTPTVSAFVYDGMGRTTQVRYDGSTTACTSTQWNAGTCLTYAYDGDGNRTSQTDQTGTVTWTYDKLGREWTRTQPGSAPAGGTSTLLYDVAGNLETVTDDYGATSYSYDEANQLTKLAEPGGSCTSTPTVRCTLFTYNNNGARVTTTYPTSPTTVMTMTPDDSGRVTQIRAALTGSSTAFSDFSYTYSRMVGSTATDGGLTRSRTDNTITSTTAGKTTTYGYDTLARLTSAVEKSSGGATTASWLYCYDLAGNRTHDLSNPASGVSCTATAANNTYNDANQLTSRNGSAPGAFLYDGNGNETAAVGSSTRTSGTWNVKSQLTSVTVGGTAIPFTYSGAGNKTRLTAGSGTSQIAYRNTALGITAQTAGSTPTTFIRDPAGTLIGARTGTATSGNTAYYLFDGQGSVIGLVGYNSTTSAWQKRNSYSYDPYGKNRSKTENLTNPFQYTGGYLDTTTGLYKLGIRYYDPTLGRFTQPDPTGQDAHYTYARNSPCNYKDPNGAESFTDIAIEVLEACASSVLEGLGLDLLGYAITGQIQVALADVALDCAIGATVEILEQAGLDDQAGLLGSLATTLDVLEFANRVL